MSSNEFAERLKKAEDSLRERPYNLDAWNILISHASNLEIKKARRIYESLIKHFPTSGRYWKMYINHEMKARCYEQVEKLFKRCLPSVYNVDLWKAYISYIREQKAAMIRNEPKIMTDGTQRPDPIYTIREQIVKAYDYALDKVGLDIHSYQIWNEYIEYLKTAPPPKCTLNLPNGPTSHGAEYSEGLRTVAVRKMYQKAVVTPLLQLEGIWRDYCAWEQSISQNIAKKETEARQREYLIAKRVAREFDQLTRGLNRNAPALPPSGGHSTDERRQVEMWRKIIEWEKCNNAKVSEATVIVKRVIFTYEQCLQCMAHHPGFWFEAANYMISAMEGFADKGSNVESELKAQIVKLFERALSDESPVRASMLLHFSFAEFLEKNRMHERANQIYARLYQEQIGGGPIQLEGHTEKELKIITGDIGSPLSGLRPIDVKDPTLAYIQHMRFARRVEGIKAARAIFKKARSDNRSRFHVYVFAARMEYTCSKDMDVAQKIFELGLKKFKKDPEFLQQYTKFMRMLNESNNTRVLYERVLNETQNQFITTKLEINRDVSSSIKFLWTDYMTFESMVGDLASISGVENRKILNTIATDANVMTDPFRLSDKERSVQNHHNNSVQATIAQPYSGRLQSQPFNAQTQKLENEIANYKNDNAHIRSDIVQRNKTAVNISRYKFLDLDACETGELKSLGIDERSRNELNTGLKQSQDAANAAKDDGNHDEINDHSALGILEGLDKADSASWRLGRRPMADVVSFDNRKKYTENEAFVRPVFSQMTPFKPEHHPMPSKFGAAGGNFPPPPEARRLMRLMPPPRCFLGPFVIVDQLLDKIRSIEMPTKSVFVQAIKHGDVEKKIKIKQENIVNPENASIVMNTATNGESTDASSNRRPAAEAVEEETTREEVDIFTMRKNKRLKKK